MCSQAGRGRAAPRAALRLTRGHVSCGCWSAFQSSFWLREVDGTDCGLLECQRDGGDGRAWRRILLSGGASPSVVRLHLRRRVPGRWMGLSSPLLHVVVAEV